MTADDHNQQRPSGDSSGIQLEHVTETPDPDTENRTEKPEVTDEHREKAKEMAKAYSDDLQTTTLPGSSGTVSGTTVTDWVDDEDKGKIETSADEGNIEYRNTDEFKRKLEE